MKNFFKRICLLCSLLSLFSIFPVKGTSELINIDSIPKVSFDSISNSYTKVEIMPQFPGGEKAMLKFLSENIHYPDQAKKDKIEGLVLVQCVIDSSGKIIEPNVIRSIGGGCDEEAVRVILLMPDFTPGYVQGEAVRVKFHIPLRFKL